jgi:hypothetical protein
MKAFLLRRQDLGYDSVLGIVRHSQQGIVGFRNDDLPADLGMYDLCIRWGCTSNVPQRKVLNTAEGIHRVFDKPAFRKTLFDHGLTLPVYTDVDDLVDYPYPLVVRPGRHQEGADFHIVNSDREFWRASVACGAGWYAAPFVQKQAEYRINCLQGRVLCVIEKSARDANDLTFGRGLVTIHYWSDWPIEACEKALRAMELSGLDFGGVDVIVGPDGVAHVLEINSGPWLEGKYQQQVFAKGFDYILHTENKEPLPLAEGPNSWKRFIHPALSDKALMVAV